MLLQEEYLIKAIKYGIYAVLFLPVAVIPWLIFPFATSRGFLFQIIVEILFALYIPLAIKNPSFRPKKTLLVWALSFFFGALALSALFGLDPYRSFWGNYERMWGLFQLAHFFLFFVILAGMFKTREEWQKFLKVSLIAGGLAAAAALAQFLWIFFSTGTAPRPGGFIGNPAFLAAYLLFTFFFALSFKRLYIFQLSRENVHSLFSLMFAVFALIAILVTGTRGAFVGLAAAAIVAAIFILIFYRRRFARLAAAAFLALIVLGALAVANYGSLFAKPERISESTFYSLNHFDAAPKEESGLGFLSRLATFSVYDTTTQTRLATWKTVLASAKDYPLFGVGSENFILAFNKYFNPEFYIAERSEIWFDRAHNAYIDMLVMHGILGLGAYLFLYASCFFVIFRLYRRGVLAPAHALAFTLFFTAYGVQNFFLFDSFGAFLMWIVAIAYLNSFSGEREAGRPSFMPVRFIAIPLMAALIVVYMFSARPMMQSYLLAKAESGVYGIDASMALYEKALSWRTFGDNETRSRLALSVAKEVQGTESEVLPENLSRYLDRAIVALKENIAQSNQYHLLYRLQLSDVYNLKLARTGMASPEVEDIMEKSIAISPGRMEFEFALAQTAFLKNEYQKAVDILQQASKKNPDHPMPYWKIAQNYHFAGRDEKGIPYVEQAFYLGFGARNYKELQWVAEYYNAKKDYVKIVFLNKKIIAQAPQLVWPHMNLAIAYANLGQKNKAKEHAQKVGALDPSQQEAVSNFLNALR